MDNESRPKAQMIKPVGLSLQGNRQTWGVEPSAGVKEALPFLVPGRVLDLGSGEGRNALFLAHRGFDVTAVDISPEAIADLTRYAARAGLQDKLRGTAADIASLPIDGPFENIISTFTLHFLHEDAYAPVLDRIMSATAEGGVNVIEDFTRDGPLYKAGVRGHWLESGELRGLYEARGWQVLNYDERKVTSQATDEQGNRIEQGAAAIVAARPTAKSGRQG